MFLCKTFMNCCLIYSNWACVAHQQDGIHPVKIPLVGIRESSDHRRARKNLKRLSLYEFTLWGRDLVSIIRIRESPHYKGFF